MHLYDVGDFKPLALLAYFNRSLRLCVIRATCPSRMVGLPGTLSKILFILNKGASNQVQQLYWALSHQRKWLALNLYLSSPEFKKLGVRWVQMNRFYSSPGGGGGFTYFNTFNPALLLKLLGMGRNYKVYCQETNKIKNKQNSCAPVHFELERAPSTTTWA